MGIEKAISASDDADLIIYVADASKKLDNNDIMILNIIKNKKTIVLINKIDIQNNEYDIKKEILKYVDINEVLEISVKNNLGIEKFTKLIKDMFFMGNLSYNEDIYITSMRQKNNLTNALNSVNMVLESIDNNMSEDFYSIDLLSAYEELGYIIGEAVEDDLVNKIFREFCMGK